MTVRGSRWPGWMAYTKPWLVLTGAGLTLLGFLCIIVYAVATPGPHLQYIGVGLLTAFAALVTGYLFGFLFGVPRVVSSGALRQSRPPVVAATPSALPADASTSAAGGATSDATAGAGKATADSAGSAQERHYSPSSNLAEVSDWLTKLLLGAGLVQLTHLGKPLSTLINAVARGLENGAPGSKISGAAQAIAGAILVEYTILGFLVGYVVTTLWYETQLDRLQNPASNDDKPTTR